MTKHHLIATAVGVASFAAGAAVGYKLSLKKLEEEFERRLEEETSHMKTFYTNVGGSTKYATPQEAVKDLILPEVVDAAMEEYKGGKNDKVAYNKIVPSVVKEKDDEDPVEQELPPANVFEPRVEDPNHPYIISQEAFMLAERGYQQGTITWYSVDEVLADENDEPIDDVGRILGEDFKVSFGEGSSDPLTVHVRNERLGMEFEVVKNEASFAEVVLGEEPTKIVRPSGRE